MRRLRRLTPEGRTRLARASVARPRSVELASRVLNSHQIPNTKKPPGGRSFGIGGGGENRTRVRKSSAPRSTCLFRL